MPDPHPHDEGAALKVAISASISLAVMLVDFLWLIRDEIKFVWPIPRRLRGSWVARMYMLTRYIGIASQVFNICFTVRMYNGVYTSPAGCRLWFIYQTFIVQFLLVFVEGLFMHRLYALFLHDRLILVILVVFAVGQAAAMGVSAALSYPSNKHTITCMMVRGNPGGAFFSTTTMTTTVIILFMTFWRYFRLPEEWTRHGLGWVVLRDSALSLSAISVMMLFMTLCSLQVIKPSMSGNITYYWFICILWLSIGRIVVNHEKIRRENDERGEGSTWKGTVQLTSQIEMGESVSSLDPECGSSDGHVPPSTTLRSLSIPMSNSKASELSPSACTSYSASKWLGDHSPIHEHERRHSPRPSNTELSTEVSIPDASQLSLSNVCAIDGDAPQTEDHPQANDANADARVHSPSPSPSPRPSSAEPPTSQV